MTVKKGTCKEGRCLFRVIFKGREYMGTAEQFHAKVVAQDFATAVNRACEAMDLDPAKLEGAVVTLIKEDVELKDGLVFDFARRSRAFGERGGWTVRDALPRKEPTGPRSSGIL